MEIINIIIEGGFESMHLRDEICEKVVRPFICWRTDVEVNVINRNLDSPIPETKEELKHDLENKQSSLDYVESSLTDSRAVVKRLQNELLKSKAEILNKTGQLNQLKLKACDSKRDSHVTALQSTVEALQEQRDTLEDEIGRLHRIIAALKTTIKELK